MTHTLFRDWKNHMSWGRVCALVALAMAVLREFQGADVFHVSLWLGMATGNYALSKATEPGGIQAMFAKIAPRAADCSPGSTVVSTAIERCPGASAGSEP
jgi:hypothetical protein